MRVVVALGGNALLRRGEPMNLATQKRNIGVAGKAIAALAREHHVILTHGNGPQVGILAMQAEAGGMAFGAGLDILGAETEGMIGYLLEQELMNQLPGREVATLLTQVEVSSVDPAFKRPTKPIGQVYEEEEAMKLARERGWVMGPDGKGYRRVVPSPRPLAICQLKTFRRLVDANVLLVCAGGGGIPVVRGEDRRLSGVDAVIDKDRTSALLAADLQADFLLLLTDVDAVYKGYGTEAQEPIRRATPEELVHLGLDEGSMGPKVGAAVAFVEQTGGVAAVGSLEQAVEVVAGRAGTWIALSKEGQGGRTVGITNEEPA